MKHLSFSLITILLSIHVIAQNLPKGFSTNERTLEFLKEIGISEDAYIQNPFQANINTTPPTDNVRTMAEWEEIEYLTITWSTDYGINEELILSQIVTNAVEQTNVIIICENQNTVDNYLINQGISTQNIYYIESEFNNIWMRDYGQNTVYKNDVDELILVDWIYNRNRPFDDLVPEAIASFLGVDMYNTTQPPWDLMATGGNFMSDGMGTAFSSELIVEENDGSYAWQNFEGYVYEPNHSISEIETILEEFMGIEDYIVMDNLPYDGIHHIDMHMKLLDEETLLIAEYPEGVADGPQIEANLQFVLDNFTSAFGTPYKIVRIPSPPSTSGLYPDNQGYYRTYTNSVILNETVLVPFYRTEYDTIAQRIYEEAMPGYNIIGIDVDNQGNNLISFSGAIHCITHSVGVEKPLLIQHQSLTDTEPLDEYLVLANIQHSSNISEATIFWTTDLTQGYYPVSMSNTNGNEWQGAITGNIDENTMVYYYIEATANSGKTLTRPLPAPEGYFDFKVLGASNIDDNQSIFFESIYPNPAKTITCIPLKINNEFNGKLSIYNMLGKEIEIIHQGNFNTHKKNYFFNAENYSSGMYFISLSTKNKIIASKKVVIE